MARVTATPVLLVQTHSYSKTSYKTGEPSNQAGAGMQFSC